MRANLNPRLITVTAPSLHYFSTFLGFEFDALVSVNVFSNFLLSRTLKMVGLPKRKHLGFQGCRVRLSLPSVINTFGLFIGKANRAKRAVS